MFICDSISESRKIVGVIFHTLLLTDIGKIYIIGIPEKIYTSQQKPNMKIKLEQIFIA